MKAVLILGAVPRIAATIARCLQRQGIAADVATFSSQETRIPSRSIRHFFRVPEPDVSQHAFVAGLTAVIGQYQHELLIAANDVALTAMIENYDSLQAVVKVACPPPQVVQRVLDKYITLSIASSCGLRIPKTVLLSNTRQLPDLLGEVGLPCVIKPSRKQRVEHFKTRLVRTVEEISIMFPQAQEFSPPMLLQEYCEGVGVGIEILMHEGRCCTAFQHRRIKEYPHGGGVAVLAVAEALNPALLEVSTRLLQALEWGGVAMVEFRIDGESAVLMEVNGRFWGSISLPVLAGIDFPFYVWQLAHNEAPQIPRNYAVGTRWRWTAGYVQRLNGILLARLKGRRSSSLRRELSELTDDFGASTRDAIWSLRDPGPGFYELLVTVGDLLAFDIKAAGHDFSRRLLSTRHATKSSLKRPVEPIL